MILRYISGNHQTTPPTELELGAPKLLGDLLESIFGAILVDCQFDCSKTWQVVSRIVMPFMDIHCQLETIKRNPVRVFQEKCHATGMQFTNIDYRFVVL